VFKIDSDSSEEIQIPKNAKISKNIGRETPTFNGPNGVKYQNQGNFPKNIKTIKNQQKNKIKH
jgi:hypothetical protein